MSRRSTSERASRREERWAAERQRQRRRTWVTWLAGLAVVVAVAGGGWLVLRASSDGGASAAGPDGLPGPLGGRDIAQDINTLVGRPAPEFTLADSEGTPHTVSPGNGKPVVLISHMGIT